MYIEELIPDLQLENKNVEFKGIIGEGNQSKGLALEIGWLKTLVAFANTEGGKLVIGVEDRNHKIVALEKKTADRIILMIHRLIRERVDPIIDYDIESLPVQSAQELRYLLSGSVEMNDNLPVTLHEGGLLGIYVRNYGRTDIATSEQIKDLVLMSDNTPFDIPFTNEDYDSRKYTKLFAVAKERKSEITKKELQSKKIISDQGKVSRGFQLFEDGCDDLRTKVVATVWPGTTKGGTVVTATEEYVGDLLTVIENTIRFIKNHSANGFRKLATQTVEYRSFPERAITEGVVNAIGHRNYYMQGTQIEVNIFKDRLEITSPGALLGVRELVRETNIAAIIPRRRNERICDLLEMCKYMEKKGSGFDNIEADYADKGKKYAPFISSDSLSFTLTLPDLTYASGVVESSEELPTVYVEEVLPGKNDLKILAFCYRKEHSAKEIAEYIGVTPSTYFRANVISRLARDGFLHEIHASKPVMFKTNSSKVLLK